MDSVEEFFGEAIAVYTRADAIEDGVLIDVDSIASGPTLREAAGFKVPVALSAAVYNDAVVVPDGKESLCSEQGRIWDILWMSRFGQSFAPNEKRFNLFALVRCEDEAKELTLKIVVHPGDSGEPVATIMYPHED